jgi:serine/threonine-protein kinase
MHAQLSLAEQEQVVLHLNECEHCQQILERLSTENGSWAAGLCGLGAGPDEAGPALQEVLKNFKKPPQGQDTSAEAAPQKGFYDFLADFLSPSKETGHLGRLGHYEILEVVGRGGMGVVLKALDETLHRVVAIKILSPHLASNATARRRFTREAQAAAAITHEHVVTIHGVEEAHDPPYIVMQYVSGMSLQERLDRDGPLEVKEILRIGSQAARGLAAAHAQGVIHRDIKPANILLENGIERVQITDFGLARTLDDASLTQSGVIAGTPQYMAPEQANGETIDHRADLFSLGSVMYALCTGRPPFRASTVMGVLKRVSEEQARPVREVNPDIPEWLEAIIEKLHAKHPEQRFQSAAEVADLLGQHLAHLQQPSQTPLPPAVKRRPAPGPRPKPRPVALWLMLAVLACFAFACCLLPLAWLFLRVSFSPVSDPATPLPSVSIAHDSGYLHPMQAADHPIAHEFVAHNKNNEIASSVQSLADAVELAHDGDTIEVHGKGSIPVAPVDIHNKALTIRAAPGSSPILIFSSDENTDTPMIQTNAPLTLEGLSFKREVRRNLSIIVGPLEIQRQGGARLEQSNEIVRVEGAALGAANCRFEVDFGYRCIRARDCPQLVVQNCHFLGHAIYAIDWAGSEKGLAVVENCVLHTQVGLCFHVQRDVHHTEIQLTHNTGVMSWPLVLMLDSWPEEAKPEGQPRACLVAMRENVFVCRHGMLHFAESDQFQAENQKLTANEKIGLLKRTLGWRDERNLYQIPPTGYMDINTRIDHVRKWEEFWTLQHDGSLQGQVRFKLGDLISPTATLEAFRLQTESLGHAAGRDGRDLGANVNLVGSGDPYERWRKTAEYREWLKASR